MAALLFLISFLATVILIVVLYPCAQKIGLMDKPNIRKLHQKPIPLIGGIAIYFGIIIALWISGIGLFHQTAFILSATILVLVGLIDDYKDLHVKYRLFAQIVAALIMTEFADIRITELGDLFGTGNIKLGFFFNSVHHIRCGWWYQCV